MIMNLKNWIKMLPAVLVLSTLFITQCQKENTTLTEVETYVDDALYAVQRGGSTGADGCYEFVFPITVQFADATTATVNNYEELKAALKAWKQANPGSGKDQHPTFVFPLSVMKQDGSIVTLNNEAELKALREECPGHFGDHGPKGHGKHFKQCFEFVFPITVAFPDGTTGSATTGAELKTLLHSWKSANPTSTEKPQFQYPIQLTLLKDGSVITVNNKEEFKAALKACKN